MGQLVEEVRRYSNGYQTESRFGALPHAAVSCGLSVAVQVCDHRNLRTNLATSKYHSVTQEVWDQLKEYTEQMVDYESDLEFCKSPAMKKSKLAVLGIQSPAKDSNKTSVGGAYELKKLEGECALCRCEETVWR